MIIYSLTGEQKGLNHVVMSTAGSGGRSVTLLAPFLNAYKYISIDLCNKNQISAEAKMFVGIILFRDCCTENVLKIKERMR